MWTHDSLDRLHMDLLAKRIIAVEGDIDDRMGMYVHEAILRLMAVGSPPIKVLITSNGGSVFVGLAIYDLLRTYSGKSTGCIFGFAKSMGVIILQGCDERLCARHSLATIHHVSQREVNLDVLRDEERLTKVREELEADQARLYKILSDRTGRSEEEVRVKCEVGRDLSSEEALEFGLIDKIVHTTLPASSPD